jgi:hypothetical protein
MSAPVLCCCLAALVLVLCIKPLPPAPMNNPSHRRVAAPGVGVPCVCVHHRVVASAPGCGRKHHAAQPHEQNSIWTGRLTSETVSRQVEGLTVSCNYMPHSIQKPCLHEAGDSQDTA